MKKLFSLVLALVLAAGLATSAFAATNFISSPSGRTLPTISSVVSDNPNVTVTPQPAGDNGEVTVQIIEEDHCKDALIITPYSAKDSMPDNVVVSSITGEDNSVKATQNQQRMEAAFVQLSNLDNFAKLPGTTSAFQTNLAAAAAQAGTTIDKLVVSDLFDISYYHISQTNSGHADAAHEDTYNIAVGDDTIYSFVALLHQPLGGTGWEIVDTTLNYATKTISFKIDVDDLSPFAIVVKKTAGGGSIDGPTSPKTADPMSLVTLAMALTASAGGLVVLGKRKHD